MGVRGRSGQYFQYGRGEPRASSGVSSARRPARPARKRDGQTSEGGGWEGGLRGRPPLRFCHAQDGDDGRGLYPPPEEHGPALAASMTIHSLESQRNSSGIRKLDQLSKAAVDRGLAGRTPALERELAERQGRVADAERSDLLQ